MIDSNVYTAALQTRATTAPTQLTTAAPVTDLYFCIFQSPAACDFGALVECSRVRPGSCNHMGSWPVDLYATVQHVSRGDTALVAYDGHLDSDCTDDAFGGLFQSNGSAVGQCQSLQLIGHQAYCMRVCMVCCTGVTACAFAV